MHDIYDNVVGLRSVDPVALSGTTAVKGVAVDTEGYQTLMLLVNIGAATGSPSSFTVDVKVQTSATTTDGDFADLSPAVAIAQQTAGSVIVPLRVTASAGLTANGGGALKRYLRAVATPSFSGGSSPTVPVSATFLGSRYAFDPVNS